MRKALLLFACATVLWVPAASVAGDSSPNLSSQLAAKMDKPHKSDARNPASTCKAQRSGSNFGVSHDGQTFSRFYGTNGGKNGRTGPNAFGRCVTAISKHKAKSDGRDSAEAGGKNRANSTDEGEDSAKRTAKGDANPATTCKTMRATDLAHFQTAYGTQPNAFGKCVSTQANNKKR
jgi:hypothetical protein